MKKKCLRFVCFIIASGELLRSLYFVFASTVWLSHEMTFFVVVSLISSFFWVANVMALFIGLLRFNIAFMKFWMFFASVGFVVHDLFVIKGAVMGNVDFSGHHGVLLIVFGIGLDGCSIYLVFYYCKVLRDQEIEEKRRLLEPVPVKKHKKDKAHREVTLTDEKELPEPAEEDKKKKKHKTKSKSNSKSKSKNKEKEKEKEKETNVT